MSRLSELAARSLARLRTIRARLTLWYVALLAVILVGFCSLLYVTLSRSLYAELDRSLATDAQQIASGLDLATGLGWFAGWADLVAPGTLVAIYDRSGQSLIANDPRQPLPVLSEALARSAQGQRTTGSVQLRDGQRWRVLALPIASGTRVVGLLQVARSERDLELALRQFLTLAAVAIPLTLLLAVAGGLFLAGRALNPIDQMTREADQISAEDLSGRLDVPPSADEVGRLASTFNRLLDRLDRAFQRQRQFTADASHELRTPLAILIGQADLALSRPRSGEEYRETLGSIREDAARMNQLLSTMLLLTRADTGQEALDFQPLRLDEVVADVVEAMRPLGEARGVALEQGPAEPLVVKGDQTKLTQLLVNLVDNGLKYTPAGGLVTVSLAREADRGVVRVSDNGIGIPAEHLPHLFERFYRVDKSRARAAGGAGLGLAISRWIVEAHHGQIEVASKPGVGSTFTVRLPLARATAVAPAASPEPLSLPSAPTA